MTSRCKLAPSFLGKTSWLRFFVSFLGAEGSPCLALLWNFWFLAVQVRFVLSQRWPFERRPSMSATGSDRLASFSGWQESKEGPGFQPVQQLTESNPKTSHAIAASDSFGVRPKRPQLRPSAGGCPIARGEAGREPKPASPSPGSPGSPPAVAQAGRRARSSVGRGGGRRLAKGR